VVPGQVAEEDVALGHVPDRRDGGLLGEHVAMGEEDTLGLAGVPLV